MANIRRVGAKQFKVIVRQGADTAGVIIAKAAETDVEQVGDRTLRFVLSTSSVDRDNDTLAVDGWDLGAFEKAGVVLWAHDNRTPPIAIPKKTWIDNGKLIGDAEFLSSDFGDHDHVKFADMVFKMYQRGVLKAVSVGFLPMEYEEAKDRGGHGYNFTKQELMEYSAVPVPSNRDALIDAADKGIDMSMLKSWAVSRLEKSSTSDLWIPKDDLKSLVKELSPVIELHSKGAISYDSAHSGGTPKADEAEEWDGPAELAAAEVDDLKIMCAWVDSAEPNLKGSYKLPHHKAEGHAVVWSGVAAAMGALLGARGGVDIPEADIDGVYSHLAKHYEEFEKEPPEKSAKQDDGEPADAVAEDQPGLDELKAEIASIKEDIDMIYSELRYLQEALGAESDEPEEPEEPEEPKAATCGCCGEDKGIDLSELLKEWKESKQPAQPPESSGPQHEEIRALIQSTVKNAVAKAMIDITGKLP